MHYTYHMSSKDKVSKSIWNLFEFTKETLKKNLATASSTDQLKLDEASLKVLFNVIDSSISEGFNKGVDSTCNKVLSTFNEQDSLKKKK